MDHLVQSFYFIKNKTESKRDINNIEIVVTELLLCMCLVLF